MTTPVAAAAAEEAAYYQAVEEFFVSRRGDPMFLSSADWHLVRKWRQAGIPLRIVMRGIADALDSHAHSWSRQRKVGSLAYCAAEVETARARWQRALALEEEPGASLDAALLDFARALDEARGLGPESAGRARTLATELRERAAAAPAGPRDLESLTRRLAEAETVLLKSIRAEGAAEATAAVEAEVDRDLAPYAGRMPVRVLDEIRVESLARRLLAVHGLPRLSLFHL